jgi:hypothetical protein
MQLPRRDEPDINVLRLVSDWLSDEESGRWLMILDNADDVKVFFGQDAEPPLAAYVPKGPNGSVLVTSRSMDAAERLVGSQRNIRRMPAMDDEQVCSLLREKLDEMYDESSGKELVRVWNASRSQLRRRPPLSTGGLQACRSPNIWTSFT